MTGSTDSIESITKKIFKEVVHEYEKQSNDSLPLFVLIGGVPGGGKSTITKKLEDELNLYFKNKEDQSRINDISKYDYKNNLKNIEILNRITDSITTNTHIHDRILNNITYDGDIKDYKSCKILKYDANGVPYYSIQSIGGEKTSIEVHLPIDNIQQNSVAVVPMDGFHIPLEILLKYKNPEEAVFKRGHFETFDSKNYSNFINLLLGGSDDCFFLKYPGFNHEDKDPIQNAHQLELTSKRNLKICILEGLYNLYNAKNYGKSIVEELKKRNKNYLSYFIDCQDEILKHRVSERHLASGIVDTIEDAVIRFRKNDLVNAMIVRNNLVQDKKLEVIFT